MLSKIFTAGIRGIDAYLICCEVDIGNGLPGMNIIGYTSTEVKEAQDRVKTAIKNSGYHLGPKKIVINLSPANIRKEGGGYDLAIAIGVLEAYGILQKESLKKAMFVGELSLGGELLPVRGIISILLCAKEAGIKEVFVPAANLYEASLLEGMQIYGLDSLAEAVSILLGNKKKKSAPVIQRKKREERGTDFSDIRAQKLLKRAAMIAAGGNHNILYIGPAGSGKSMMAGAIPGIMPGMSREEELEVLKIYSICGILPEDSFFEEKRRPFRSPHHTISRQSMIGGGMIPKPGEVSLSHQGVLFLDEFAEFRQEVMEVLRQPLEDKQVHISRINGRFSFPADFLLCLATNPCKCGFYPDRSRCCCSEGQVRSYLGKISRPLLDRIDICAEARLLPYEELQSSHPAEETSAFVRKRVEEVREIQRIRFANSKNRWNGDMDKKALDAYCALSEQDHAFLREVYEKRGMSVRSLYKILRVARTIADFEKKEKISRMHLSEALAYRSLFDKYWGGLKEY